MQLFLTICFYLVYLFVISYNPMESSDLTSTFPSGPGKMASAPLIPGSDEGRESES